MDLMRSPFTRGLILLAVAAFLAPGSASAIQHEVRLLLDLDNDPGTGCLVPTVAGPFDGVEQVLITTVDTTSPPPAGTVTDVAVSECVSPATDTFGVPASFDGGWPIGIDNGVGGLDVVETYLPLVSAAVPDPSIVRLALVVADELGGEQALLTRDGTPGGEAILLDLQSVLEIPTLGEWALILLALLLAGASITLLGRRGATAAFLVVLVLGAGAVWAAPGLDGLISDWFGNDILASNGMALFGKQDGTDLCFRVDVELLFNTSPTADPQAVTTDEDTPVAITLTGSDPESDPLTFTIVPGSGPDHGTLSGAPPNVTYTPDPDYEGPDSFDFQVEDPSAATGTATVSITVNGVNDAPVVDAAAFSVAEDEPVGATVGTVTFTDPDAGQSHTFAITAGNTGGAFAIGAATGEITTAAALDFETLDTYALTVEVTDDGAPVLSGSNTVTVNVTDVDDAPVAVDDAATVTEDDPATAIDVLANDTDTDGGPKAIASASDPVNGTVVLTGGSAGAHTGLTYEPDPDYCNDPPGTTPDTFTYTLTPGGDVATVSVTVTCVNDDPVAVDDAVTVAEDSGATTIDVQANDTDADGDTNTITAVQDPSTAGGTVLITNAGADLSYQPAADYCNDPPGTTLDTFTYTLSPGGSTATVTVTVTCEDDPPVAVDDVATVAEDSGANPIDVLANDTDVDAGPKTVASVQNPSANGGTVLATGGGTGVSYSPAANYCNSPPGTTLDTFTYTLNGGSVATVTVTVTCDDDPPLAVNDAATVAEDSGPNTIDVRLNDTDIDGGPMTVTLVQNPSTAGGTVLITNLGADVSYEPAADYCNSPPGTTLDTFTYTLNGGSTATVTVTVTCVNDAPVLDLDADDDKGTGGANFAVAYTEGDGAELLEDPDDPLGATITDVDSTTLVSLTVTLTNLLDAGEELLDADVSAFSPDIIKDYDTTTPGVGVLTISSVTPQPIADYVAILRTVTYEHTGDDPDDTAARVVQFVANDGTNDSNTATSTVTLTVVDDDPVAVDDAATVTEDSGATLIDVLANDTDTDGGPMTIASASDPANGTVVVAGDDLSLTYQPDPNYCNDGSPVDSFTYELAPGGDTGTVSVTVTCVNDAPAGTDNTVTTDEETAHVFAAADFGFTDPDDTPADSLSAVTITTLPAAGSLTLSGSGVSTGQSIPVADLTAGNLEFTPAANGTGTPYTSFTFQVQDDGGTANGGVDLDPSANTLSINVNNVNDAPAGTDNTVATAEDTQYTFAAGDFGFTDPNDSPADALAAVRITTLPGAGSLTLSGGGFVAGTEILVGDITAGNLKFSPAANGSGSPYTTFTFQVRDDGGTANGGVDLDGSANTMTVNVTPVNDPPVGAANTVTTDEDVLYTFTTADFPFTDPNDSPADALASVIITTLPADGSLTLGGSGFAAGTEVPVASITGGQLQFVSDLNEFGTPYTSFTFQVRDDGGTANGGVDLDATPRTLTINVNPVNDPPTFTDATIDYTTAGNTQLRAGEAATGASVAHEQDNLDIGEKSGPSDVDGPGPPFAYSLASGPANGQATVNGDGTFTYEPNAGFHGPTDSFMVNVSDGGTPAGIGVVTVTVTISEMVWYVHDVTGANNPAAGDTGRSTNAFDSIAELVAANPITPDDYVFVFAGNTAATPHSTELVIDDSGVKLHGQGVGLTVPGVGTLVPAGAKPRWVVAADNAGEDNAVTVDATAGSLTGVEIRGLDLTGRDNAIDVTATGAFNAGVTIGDNTIASDATTGLEGVDVNAAGTGTVTVTASNNTLSGRGNAFDARSTVAGSALRVAFSNHADVLSTNASAVVIDGSAGGTATVTGFANNSVHQATAGSGILVTSATFDGTPGGAYQQVSGGNTRVGTPGDAVGASGVLLTNVAGDLAFTDLDIFAGPGDPTGAGLRVTGTGAVNPGAGTGTRVTVTPNAGIIQTTTVRGVDVQNATLDLQLNDLDVASASTTGVWLVNVADGGGTNAVFTAPSGATITTTAGAGAAIFNVSGGNAKITYAGTINNTGNSRAVSISGWSGDDAGDDVLFSGAITESGAGILLNANGGSRSITFSGGLDIDTGANEGFAATSNTNTGGLHITGTNTIDTTTATALRVTNSGIGSSGLTFRSITAGTGVGSNGVGIVLDGTGTGGGNGGLTVTGTGTPGSGGTIQHKTGADGSTTAGIGIFLKDTKSPSFSWIQLNDFANSAITGRNVQGFTLQNSVINGTIGTTNVGAEGPINFGLSNPGGTNGLQGTGLIRNTKISGGVEHNLEFYNQSGSMNLTIEGTTAVSEGANLGSPLDDVADCIIEENSVGLGGDGIQIEMQNTATATVVIDRCLFRDNKSQAVQVSALNSTNVVLTIDESFARKFDQGNEGFILQNGADADLTVIVSNNRINNFGGTGIFVGQVAGNATAASELHATITGNIVTQPTTATNHGIIAFLTSTVGQVSQARLNIQGNTVTNNSTSGTTRGILVDTPDGSTTPAFHATVSGNTVSVGDNVNGVSGLVVQGRQGADTCANIHSNTVTFPNGTPAGINGLRARQANTATFDLEQGPGCAGTAAAVLACRNPASTTEVLGTLTVVPAGTCLLPSTP